MLRKLSCNAFVYINLLLLKMLSLWGTADTVVHSDHTLSCNLSDSEDIEIKTKDIIRHANCLLLNFCTKISREAPLESKLQIGSVEHTGDSIRMQSSSNLLKHEASAIR